MRKITTFLSRNFPTIKNHVVPSSTTPLGISKQKPMKRTVIRKNKNKKTATKDLIFNKVVSYLLSDSYMYNPLISPQPTFDFPPPKQILTPSGSLEDVALPIKGRNKKLIEKEFDFLEADCYLYSPLINNDHVRSKSHAENINSGHPPTRGESERTQGGKMQQGAREGRDLSRELRARPAVRKSVAYREPVKSVIH